MRDILFRGKRVDTGEWIYGVPITDKSRNDTYIITSTAGASLKSEINNMCATGFRIIRNTIVQYTGLTDENGTRIFEGDIIKVLLSGNPQPIGVVKYGVTGICGFCVMTERGYSNYVLNKSEYFEVIGNIHDNPELLKGD